MANPISIFIVNNLLSIHSGSVVSKVSATFKLAVVPAVGISISERFTGWYIDAQFFIILLTGGLLGDLIIGIIKHLKLNSFSFKKMLLGFTLKMAIITIAYFFTEAILQIISEGEMDSIYFKVISKLAIFLFPAGNAAINMGIITNGKFPPLGFLMKFEKFNKTLDVNIFKEKQNESENTDNNTTE
ncbi:hypothetical protein [Chryseobacterium sp. JK1]|uniref:hypothetical protein n=1 Tax=Chryseobacterium sp. JK1 TaxID=874294 RepID=UPI003D680B19